MFNNKNTSIQESFNAAITGDYEKVDLTIEDVYGSIGISILNLPKELIAASLGKLQKQEITDYKKEDILNSLFVSFIENVASIACLVS